MIYPVWKLRVPHILDGSPGEKAQEKTVGPGHPTLPQSVTDVNCPAIMALMQIGSPKGGTIVAHDVSGW